MLDESGAEVTLWPTAVHCFKYRTFEGTIRCLEDGSLYFAKPDRLNDTLEGQFDDVALGDFQRIFEMTLSEVSQRRGGSPLTLDTAAMSEAATIFARENGRFRSFVANTGVFSASTRPDHQVLWTHYADEHRGTCLELSWPQELIQRYEIIVAPVRYKAGPRTFNRADSWRESFLCLAEEIFPAKDLAELDQESLTERFRKWWGKRAVLDALTVKDPCWEYEDEIRLILPEGDKPLPVLSDVLKRIYFIEPPDVLSRQKKAEQKEKYQKSVKRIYELIATRYQHVEIQWAQFHHGDVRFLQHPMQLWLVPESGVGTDLEELPFLSRLAVRREQALLPEAVFDPMNQQDTGQREEKGSVGMGDSSGPNHED